MNEEEMKKAKKEARASARKILLGLDAAEREEKSQKAALSFLESSIYKDAECLAAFLSMPEEIDTFPVIKKAAFDKKEILLPRIIPSTNKMDFYALNAGGLFDLKSLYSQTELNSWNIREPLKSLKPIPKNEFPKKTALLIPGLAFCKDGRRLGRGKGFYDRFLAELFAENDLFRLEGKICGYCYSNQIVESLPVEENDILASAICSDQGFFFCEK